MTTLEEGHVTNIEGVDCRLPSEPHSLKYCLWFRKLSDGRIAVGYLEAEDDYEDPFGDGSWYRIGSFSINHVNHINPSDPEFVKLIKPKTVQMVVPLSFYKHSGSLWYVENEAPPGADCPFDSVKRAGAWLPGAECIQYIRHQAALIAALGYSEACGDGWFKHKPRDRGACVRYIQKSQHMSKADVEAKLWEAERMLATEYARRACTTWNAYLNGEVYRIRQVIFAPDGSLLQDLQDPERGGSSGTYYGSDSAEKEINDWLGGLE